MCATFLMSATNDTNCMLFLSVPHARAIDRSPEP